VLISTASSDITSVKADITAKFSQLQENNDKLQESLRAEANAESERLIQRMDQQGQQLRKETSAKLDGEARRLTTLMGRVQQETEAEFVAVKEQLKIVTTGFESRVEQGATRNKEVVEDLANQLVDHRDEVDNTRKARPGNE
jgi:hypothetical protein